MSYVKSFFFYSLMVGGLLFWFFVAVNIASEERVIRYDCSLAEISPDYPLQVKEDCRKLKSVHV